jgi:hypothetical protein
VTQQVLQKFADAIQQSGVDIVPRVLIKGNAEGDTGTGSVIEALRRQIRDSMKGTPGETKPDKK